MKNTFIFMIIQALLISLLFFSEGYLKYVTIALFLLIDLILFIGLLTNKWSFKELLIFAAIFSSGMFIIFYTFAKSLITTILGVVLIILFLVIALLELLSQPSQTVPYKSQRTFDKIQKPEEPDYYYDVEYDTLPVITPQEKSKEKSFVPKPAEPIMHITPEKSDTNSKVAARAIAHELEKQAMQLQNAERTIKDLEIYNAEKELLKEAEALEDVQKQINSMKVLIAQKNIKRAVKEDTKKIIKEDVARVAKEDTKKTLQARDELKREAAELLKVQKQINEINRLKRVNELKREAKELQDASKKVNEIQFLNKQEQLAKQAKSIANAQKQINEVNRVKQITELKREAKELQDAQKKTDKIQFSNKSKQLEKQAKSIANAQKQINAITKIKRTNELNREAKELQDASKKINEIQFLNKQEQLVKQAKSIAQAQKEIDEMNKSTKKSLVKQASKNVPIIKKPIKVKTIKAPEESFYFATENSNKFHEPDCLAIKKVPKNKLILYTSKKDAMKKGLRACNTCIPK